MRVSSLVAAFVALTVCPVAASGQRAPAPPLAKSMLADGIYLFRAPEALDKWTSTNVVVIVGDDDVTVFDSNSRTGTARMVIDEIRKITAKPVRTLINSHWHLDHWSGNEEYVKAYPGVRIIATTETRDYMRRMTSRFFADGIEASVTRARARLDTAVRDGTLTAEERQKREHEIAESAALGAEVASVRRVLPDIVYRDTLIFWSGAREMRLISATGDATGSTVLYLPREKILVMGDVLVRPETGDGPPPWTTNSYAITPWRNSLRDLARLDVATIVPGQGDALRGTEYLDTTVSLFDAILTQVHAILERGFQPVSEVVKLVDVESIGRRYMRDGAPSSPDFRELVTSLVRKVHQETLDGVSKP